jgi:hypothetical protein
MTENGDANSVHGVNAQTERDGSFFGELVTRLRT